jgi:hypothetical protein
MFLIFALDVYNCGSLREGAAVINMSVTAFGRKGAIRGYENYLLVFTLHHLNTAKYSVSKQTLRASGVVCGIKLCRWRIDVVVSPKCALRTTPAGQNSSCEM